MIILLFKVLAQLYWLSERVIPVYPSIYCNNYLIIYSFSFLLGWGEALVTNLQNNHSSAFGNMMVQISFYLFMGHLFKYLWVLYRIFIEKPRLSPNLKGL